MLKSKKAPTKRQAKKQATLADKASRPDDSQGVRPNPWPEGTVLIHVQSQDENVFFTGQALNVAFSHGNLSGRVEIKLLSTEEV
jgi:hypothetical protein